MICLLAPAIAAVSQTHQLVRKWETDSVFKVPESVLYDSENKVLYVSNIDGPPWGKDGKGSIGKLGLDGKVIAVEWVTGLSAPKGMAKFKNNLYVADVDEVVTIDIEKGQIIRRISIDSAQALNDITVDSKGVLYVSDSRRKLVHRIEDGRVGVWLDKLTGPNGVLFHKGDLYVLDNGVMNKVEKGNRSLTMLASGMEGGTDGVENVQGDEFIVSCWGGVVYYVKAKSGIEKLLDTREQKINSADIGYDAVNRIVYVPTFYKNSVVAYDLK